MGLMDFRPLVAVTINGLPLGNALFSTISSVSLTDQAGLSSDALEIVFSNTGLFSRILMPKPGAEIEVAMGYLGKFRPMGIFIAEEVEESSPPRQIVVSAIAKVQGETQSGFTPIHEQRTRSWGADLTLGDIVETIAGENGLEPSVTEIAAAIVPGHIDQIDESDLSVLTRIALAHDLIAKPAGGHLFVGRRADSITASGNPMPLTLLTEAKVSHWSMRRSLGEAVGTVIAVWRDYDQGADVEVIAGEGKPERRIRQRFNNQESAQGAADAELRRSGRAVENLEVSMPGNPNIVSEGTVILAGFSSAADGEWIIKSAMHNVSDAGYQTSFNAERPE